MPNTSDLHANASDLGEMRVSDAKNALQLRQPEADEQLATGPIDDLHTHETDYPCPGCGNALDFVPAQAGPCHSGVFVNRVLIEHYWCSECADIWVEGI